MCVFFSMVINYEDVFWKVSYCSVNERYDLLLLLAHIILRKKNCRLFFPERSLINRSLYLLLSLWLSAVAGLLIPVIWSGLLFGPRQTAWSSVLRLHCSVVWTQSETEAQKQNYYRLLISCSFFSQPQSRLNPAFYSALFLTSHEPSSRANLPSDKSIALIGLAGNESHTSLPFL